MGKEYSYTVEDFQMAFDRSLLLNLRLTPNDPQCNKITAQSYDQFYDEYV